MCISPSKKENAVEFAFRIAKIESKELPTSSRYREVGDLVRATKGMIDYPAFPLTTEVLGLPSGVLPFEQVYLQPSIPRQE